MPQFLQARLTLPGSLASINQFNLRLICSSLVNCILWVTSIVGDVTLMELHQYTPSECYPCLKTTYPPRRCSLTGAVLYANNYYVFRIPLNLLD